MAAGRIADAAAVHAGERTGDGGMKKRQTDCDSCLYYYYDEEYDCYCCDVNLDEDELAGFLRDETYHCPWYKMGDEYSIVRKQM